MVKSTGEWKRELTTVDGDEEGEEKKTRDGGEGIGDRHGIRGGESHVQ